MAGLLQLMMFCVVGDEVNLSSHLDFRDSSVECMFLQLNLTN